MMNKGRIKYIDFVKGIGIFLVIIGHIFIDSTIAIYIYMFHMPLFFIISGFLDSGQKENIKEVVINKAKSLLYPYIVFGILIIIYNTIYELIFDKSFSFEMLIKRVVALLYGNVIFENNSKYIGTLWFLLALFFTVILYKFLIVRFHKYIQLILVIGILCLGIVIKNFFVNNGYRLPFCLDIVCFSTSFYFVGTILKLLYQYIIGKIRILVSVCLVLIGFIIGYLNSFVVNKEIIRPDMLYLRFGNSFIYLLSSCFISAGLILFVSLFENKIKSSSNKLVMGICYSGRMSLIIMIDHLYVYDLVNIIFQKIHLYFPVLVFVFGLLLIYVVSYLIFRYFLILYTPNKLSKKSR